MLRRHFNFRQISHRFTSSFANPSFQDLNGSHNVLKYDNFKYVEVQGWTPSKYWYFCTERWDLLSLRFSENAVLFHIESLCQKTTGNVNQPPYRYNGVTHWACPASSGTQHNKINATTNLSGGVSLMKTFSLTNCLKILLYYSDISVVYWFFRQHQYGFHYNAQDAKVHLWKKKST